VAFPAVSGALRSQEPRVVGKVPGAFQKVILEFLGCVLYTSHSHALFAGHGASIHSLLKK
jgi:hypothetical protein